MTGVQTCALPIFALLAVASIGEHDGDAYLRAIVSAALAFGGFRLLHGIKPQGLGYGDVRLSAVLGLNLGWLGWGYLPFGLFTGFVYGTGFGIVLLADRLPRVTVTLQQWLVDLRLDWIVRLG